jgi:hypothetical protein
VDEGAGLRAHRLAAIIWADGGQSPNLIVKFKEDSNAQLPGLCGCVVDSFVVF